MGTRFDRYNMEYDVYTSPMNDVPTQDMYMQIPNSDRKKFFAFFEIVDITKNFVKAKVDYYHQKTERDFDIWMDMYMDVAVPFPPFILNVMDYTLNTRTHNEQVSDGGNFQMDWEFGEHYIVAGYNVNNDDINGTTKTRHRWGNNLGGSSANEHYVCNATMLTNAGIFTGRGANI